ncbi:MAG: signal peptidase II [Candidatus Methylomirabilales bacterium]
MSAASFYSIALIITVLDQLSKFAVQEKLDLGQVIPIIPSFFNLTYVLNPGAAFGFLSGASAAFRNPFFITISVIAVLFILYYRSHHRGMSLLPSLGLAFILGGALGNLIDRLRIGMVVDFLDFFYGSYHWPAFNIADSAITVGVTLMVFEILTDRGKG